MSNIAIRVENLGKMYRIGAEETRPDNLWQATKQLVASPFDYLRRITRPPTEEEILWALKDVSFEVQRGEVVGIIGRNGAGKSTLLKILSRITEPTTGRAEIHGRVGSLLEVGTGFHPELTGRENIYLNGAILGMKREEIDRKFDEIVDFSGVEKFIDTPVKRYSSGMRVRLAFSVAAHLDPEILLIDEVLAVGDAAFQKKCLGKMADVAGGGRTIIFVSHDMAAIRNLCSRGLCLSNGQILIQGDIEKVVDGYLKSTGDLTAIPLHSREDRRGEGPLRFQSVSFETAGGKPLTSWRCGDSGVVVLSYRIDGKQNSCYADIGFSANSLLGIPLFQCFTKLVPNWSGKVPMQGNANCYIPSLNIKPGTYTLNLYAEVNGQTSDWVQEAAELTIVESDFFGSGRLPEHRSHMLLQQEWSVTRIKQNEDN